MAEKQDGASEQPADTGAMIEEGSGEAASEIGRKDAGSAQTGGDGKLRSLLLKRGPSKRWKRAAEPSAAPTGKTVKNRFLERLDNVVFFTVRAVLFGVIAAAAGVTAAFLLRQYEGSLPWDSGVRSEIAALNSAVSAAQTSVQSLGGRLDTLARAEDQIAVLNEEMAALRSLIEDSSGAADDLGAEIRNLSERLTLAEESLAENANEIRELRLVASDGGRNALIQDIMLRLDSLESAGAPVPGAEPVGSSAQPGPSRAFDARLSAAETKIGQLEKFYSDVESGGEAAADLEAVEIRVLALEESRRDGVDTAKLQSRLAAVEGVIEELTPSGALRSQQARRIALLGVRSAAEIGAPYSALISGAEWPPGGFPEVVLTHSDTGVATLEYLRAEFIGYSRQLLSSPAASPDSGGFSGMLKRLFRIRPLSPREGAEPAAVLSRAEEDLRRNDLSGALAHLSALPDQGREIMADWIEAAEARVAVLAALDSMLKAAETE